MEGNKLTAGLFMPHAKVPLKEQDLTPADGGRGTGYRRDPLSRDSPDGPM